MFNALFRLYRTSYLSLDIETQCEIQLGDGLRLSIRNLKIFWMASQNLKSYQSNPPLPEKHQNCLDLKCSPIPEQVALKFLEFYVSGLGERYPKTI